MKHSAIYQTAAKVRQGERLMPDEAITLWKEAETTLLEELATLKRGEINGDLLYYNCNFHIEPTNICIFGCRFCSYHRDPSSSEAWNYSLDEMEALARSYIGKPVTEVHIVGGVHPSHTLDYYIEIVRRIKLILPDITVKAFSAIELAHIINRAGLDIKEGLARLKEAGLEAIPGGGAEIFDSEIRKRICPEKGDAEVWLSLHHAAHEAAIPTNATMLYGHIESIEHRVDHLVRIRELQDDTKGFSAFIPLKFRSASNSMSFLGEVGIEEDMRTVAMSRILLDNIPHIKAYWPMYGKQAAETALRFGADDIDGTIENTTKVYSMAGSEEQNPSLSVNEIRQMAARAGLRAVERDTFYKCL